MLRSLVARGGMGEVWRARHRETGAAAAIKLVRADRLARPEWGRALAAEIRAAASLRHPAVVRILDAGSLDGQPWLAMEWLGGGSLAERPPRDWAEVSRVATALLDALGHAHARGLVHRDVKPANVLRTRRGSVRLVDFGLVVELDLGGESAPRGGSPGYAAPEQLSGASWEVGPWTDLHGVGALVWALVSGRAPPGGSLRALVPAMDIPVGLDAWLAVTTAPDWRERWACAAHAAAALRALGAPVPRASLGELHIPVEDTSTLLFDDADVHGPAGGRIERPSAPVIEIGRCPTAGRVRGSRGLGLLGVEGGPLLGRDAERRRLWRELRAVHRTGRTRVVVLSGPRGVGKSRLARWLARASAARGVALPSMATHDPVPGRDHGLQGLLARALGGRAPVASAAARLPAELAEGIAEWLGEAPPRLLHSAAARRRLVREVVGALAEGRPAVVVLDDASLDTDPALLAAEWRQEGPPALLILTRDDDASPLEVQGLQVALAPLTPDAMEDLAQELGLPQGGPRASVLGTAGGLPGVALEAAHCLAAIGHVPPDSAQRWAARIGALGASRAELQCLAAAVVLGPRVDDPEWRAAVEALGCTAGLSVLSLLLSAGLAVPDPAAGAGRWRLVTADLEGVLPLSLDDLADVQRACASVVQGDRRARLFERIGDAPRAAAAWGAHAYWSYDRDPAASLEACLRAVALAGDLDEQLTHEMLAAQAAYLIGDPRLDDIVASAVRLATELDDPGRWASMRYIQLMAARNHGEALRSEFREVADAMEVSGELRAAAVVLGVSLSDVPSDADAEATLDRAEGLLDRAGIEESEVRDWLRLKRAARWLFLEEPARAREVLDTLAPGALTSLNRCFWLELRGLCAQPDEDARPWLLQAISARAEVGIDTFVAQRRLTQLAMAEGDWEGALAWTVADPDSPHHADRLAQRTIVQLRMGRPRAARRTLQQLLERPACLLSPQDRDELVAALRQTGHPRLAERVIDHR